MLLVVPPVLDVLLVVEVPPVLDVLLVVEVPPVLDVLLVLELPPVLDELPFELLPDPPLDVDEEEEGVSAEEANSAAWLFIAVPAAKPNSQVAPTIKVPKIPSNSAYSAAVAPERSARR